MMSSRHDSIVDNENRSNRWIRASLTERFFCLVECRAHELLVSCSIHSLGKSIVVLARPGNAASLNILALAALSEHQWSVRHRSVGAIRAWRDSNPQPSDPKSEALSG